MGSSSASFVFSHFSIVMPECFRQARPRAKRGQGVSGIQFDQLLDSRLRGNDAFRSLLHFIELRRGRFHKRLEQWMRPIGSALEFRMELRTDHEGMIGQFGDFHQTSIR